MWVCEGNKHLTTHNMIEKENGKKPFINVMYYGTVQQKWPCDVWNMDIGSLNPLIRLLQSSRVVISRYPSEFWLSTIFAWKLNFLHTLGINWSTWTRSACLKLILTLKTRKMSHFRQYLQKNYKQLLHRVILWSNI